MQGVYRVTGLPTAGSGFHGFFNGDMIGIELDTIGYKGDFRGIYVDMMVISWDATVGYSGDFMGFTGINVIFNGVPIWIQW